MIASEKVLNFFKNNVNKKVIKRQNTKFFHWEREIEKQQTIEWNTKNIDDKTHNQNLNTPFPFNQGNAVSLQIKGQQVLN